MLFTIILISVSVSIGFVAGCFWVGVVQTPFPPVPNNAGSPGDTSLTPNFRTVEVPDALREDDCQ